MKRMAHAMASALDRQLVDREAADDFLGLGERAVVTVNLPPA